MKIATVIFSIFLLGLTLFPCDDMDNNSNCSTETRFHAGDNHEHDAETDLCSPFCQCHCCHTHVTNQLPSELNASLILFSETESGYSYNLGKDISDSLLQPPQL